MVHRTGEKWGTGSPIRTKFGDGAPNWGKKWGSGAPNWGKVGNNQSVGLAIHVICSFGEYNNKLVFRNICV